MMIKSVYLDVCALSRPFDNQDYLRIRLETEAVNLILLKVREGNLKFLISTAHSTEIEAIPDLFERIQLQTTIDEIGHPIIRDILQIRARAEELIEEGFGIADAAHVAFAEYSRAEFITCDARLVKKSLARNIKVWCGNPVTFCEKEGLK